jgi:hypothetical protein
MLVVNLVKSANVLITAPTLLPKLPSSLLSPSNHPSVFMLALHNLFQILECSCLTVDARYVNSTRIVQRTEDELDGLPLCLSASRQ